MGQSGQCLSRGARFFATVLLTSGGALATAAQAGTLTLGPVEQVNVKSSTLVVLGQTYRLASSTRVISGTTGAAISLGSIAPGTLVAIDGTESASGAINLQDVASLQQLNVPGATQLGVTGIVSAVSNTGQVRIGKLSVDINATLTSDSKGVAVGQLVTVVGTQPASGGLFLASADGIAGSGQSSLGIAGSGTSSLGIAGSGTSAEGIAGSGTSSLGIAGSGASADGIAGSGQSSLGIAGSGTSTKGIAGSGTSSLGIAGSGVSADGIAGSGTN